MNLHVYSFSRLFSPYFFKLSATSFSFSLLYMCSHNSIYEGLMVFHMFLIFSSLFLISFYISNANFKWWPVLKFAIFFFFMIKSCIKTLYWIFRFIIAFFNSRISVWFFFMVYGLYFLSFSFCLCIHLLM